MPAKDGLISSYFTHKQPSPSDPVLSLGPELVQREGEGRGGKRARLHGPSRGDDGGSSRRADLGQWKYDQGAASARLGPAPGESEGDDDEEQQPLPTQPVRTAEQEARHAAFSAKLLGSTQPRRDDQRRPAEVIEIDDDGDGSSGEERQEADTAIAKFAAPASAARKLAVSSKKGGAAEGSSEGIKYTPLEKQYLELQKEHPRVLLFVEVGYKFKIYGDDARVASRELNIACFMEKHLWTAMVPLHRLHIHIKKLVLAGHKVGVVRQTETRALKAASSNASKPFTRQMTELYTASTWVDDMSETPLLDGGNPSSPRSLVVIVEKVDGQEERAEVGIVAIQSTTGTITYDQFPDNSMRSELETRLAHLEPVEVVLPGETSKPTGRLLRYLAGQTSMSSIRIEERARAPSYNEAFAAVGHFYSQGGFVQGEEDRSASVDGANVLSVVVGLPPLALIALAVSIEHLSAFHLESVFRLATNFTSFGSRHEMLLTGNTLSNLEILQNNTDYREKGSLMWMLGAGCTTAMGSRLLRRWLTRPLTDADKLRQRSDAVESLAKERHITTRSSSLLKGLPDLERGLARLNYGRAAPTELATMLLSLHRVTTEFEPDQYPNSLGSPLLDDCIATLPRGRPVIQAALAEVSIPKARDNCKRDLFTDVDRYSYLQDTKDLLSVVDCDLHEHLLELRKVVRNPRLQYSSVAGEDYLVEVIKDTRLPIPADWTRINSTKKMIRYRSPTILTLMKQRDRLQETLEAQASEAFDSFVRTFCDQHYPLLRAIVTALATLDALVSLSALARLPGYSRAEIVDDGGCLDLRGFRHPMTEAMQEVNSYVDNDVLLGDGAPDAARAVLLTGSNMGGKSSTVRAIALVVVMAQVGSFVPARHARLSLHDAVLTRMGASDQLAKGRSTFMVEVQETAEIMRTATRRSLVLLDELGRGTSTHDGQAIAEAVLQHLLEREADRQPMLFFVTHFLSLGRLMHSLPLRPMHMAYLDRGDGDISFLYKMRPGLAEKSFGIHCARLAGLPSSLLLLASDKANELEESTRKRGVERRQARAAQLARLLFTPSPAPSDPVTSDPFFQLASAAAVLGITL